MTEQDEMTIELGPFLAAIIEQEGGTYRIPYATLVNQDGIKALTIDLEDDGATLVLGLVDAEENNDG